MVYRLNVNSFLDVYYLLARFQVMPHKAIIVPVCHQSIFQGPIPCHIDNVIVKVCINNSNCIFSVLSIRLKPLILYVSKDKCLVVL